MRSDPRFASQMSAEYAEMVADAAHLHDIGKISIPGFNFTEKGKIDRGRIYHHEIPSDGRCSYPRRNDKRRGK